MEFNFNEFLQQQEVINTSLIKSNQNFGMALKDIKENSVDAISEGLNELQTKYKKLENSVDIVNNNLKSTTIKIETLEKSNEELKDKVLILGNNQDGRFNDFKKIAIGRVHRLLGDKGSDKYILFFSSYSLKIYIDTTRILKVSRIGNIPDRTPEQFEKAKALAGNWSPTKKYLREKYNEYYTMYIKGTLLGSKLIAFENYKKITQDGDNLGI